MVKIGIQYQGDLHCSAVHFPSKKELETDAPVDNQGRGESFSPTDLVAAALGACMATIMAISARKHGIELEGMRLEVVKEMTQDGPRKISRLSTEIWMPLPIAEDKRKALELAAEACPVHRSLAADVEKPVVFHWA